MQQFSKNFFYEKEENIINLFDSQGDRVVSLSFAFNDKQSIISHSFKKFNDKFKSFQCLSEILFELVMGALIESANILKLIDIPLSKKDFNIFFQKFKNEYGDRINITDVKVDSFGEIARLTIEIKNPKNTHFIQQAYLRNFSSNKGEWENNRKKEKARLFVYNKKNLTIQEVGKTSPEKMSGLKISYIAKKEYFHTLPMEQLLRKTFEKDASLVFKKIIQFKSIKFLTNKEKEVFLKYIVLTWQRPLESRERLRESYVKSILLFAKDFKGEDSPKNIKIEMNDAYLKRLHETEILNFLNPTSEHYNIPHFFNFEWRIIKARNLDYFLTSDNPVIFNNTYYIQQKRKGNDFIKKQIEQIKKMANLNEGSSYIEFISPHPERALRQKGVEIYLPISPNICICIYDKQDNVKPLSLKKINKEIVLQANEYIFSHKKNFSFVEKILKKSPEHRERNGKRTIVKASFKKILKETEYKLKNIPRKVYEESLKDN